MTDPADARIALADDILEYLQLARSWVATLIEPSERRFSPGAPLRRVLDGLDLHVADATALVAKVSETHPTILRRCPVAVLCTCPSLSTIRSIYSAASALFHGISYELSIESGRVRQSRVDAATVRLQERAADDYRRAASAWDSTSVNLGWVAAELAAMPSAHCDRCGAPDVITSAIETAGDSELGETAGRTPPERRHRSAWIASPDAVVGELQRAEEQADALLQRERGIQAAFRYMLDFRWRGYSRRRLAEALRETTVDLELLLDDVRGLHPEALDRCWVAVPCTCPSLNTLHGLNRVRLALAAAIGNALARADREGDVALRSQADRRLLARLTTPGFGDGYRLRAALSAVEDDTRPGDFESCDRCSATDVFRVLSSAA